MPNNTLHEATEVASVGPGIFPDTATIPLCTSNTCTSGHMWPATVAIAPCPGCKTGVLAVKKENCPVCNEPIASMSLRSDHIPRGGGLAARCLGQKPGGDSMQIYIERTEWRDTEASSPLFLERESSEKALQTPQAQ